MPNETNFEIEALLAHLRDEATSATLVVIPPAPDGRNEGYDPYPLDLSAELKQAFKGNLARRIQPMVSSTTRIVYYDSADLPEEGVSVVASFDQLHDSPLAQAIRSQGMDSTRVSLPRSAPPSSDAIPRAQGYALAVTNEHDDAFLIRRRDPGVQLRRKGYISAVLSGTELSEARDVVTFDDGVDVVLWRGQVLIRNIAAFEALFYPPETRARLAAEVAERLKAKVPFANHGALLAVAREDSVFAARLRRLAKSEAFADLELNRLRPSLVRFGLDTRFISGNTLVFPSDPYWRWAFLHALEDGLVESPGSGRLYASTSHRTWRRFQVTGVQRVGGGDIGICGPGWGPVPEEDAAKQLVRAQATYFIVMNGEIVEVMPKDGRLEALMNGQDVLSNLPNCPSDLTS